MVKAQRERWTVRRPKTPRNLAPSTFPFQLNLPPPQARPPSPKTNPSTGSVAIFAIEAHEATPLLLPPIIFFPRVHQRPPPISTLPQYWDRPPPSPSLPPLLLFYLNTQSAHTRWRAKTRTMNSTPSRYSSMS